MNPSSERAVAGQPDPLAPLQIARELWDFLRSCPEDRKCVAWVGSGFSNRGDPRFGNVPANAAGYPDWPETVARLCADCGIEPLEPKSRDGTQLIKKAEECKRAKEQAYKTTLASLFGGPVIDTKRRYHLLMKLPFQAYVTTNFDAQLYSAAGIHSCQRVYAYPDLPPEELKGDTAVFYIHGLARDHNALTQASGDNLVFAKDEFDDAYEGAVRMFLDPLLSYHPLIFFGSSLSEPSMAETFGRVHRIQSQIARAKPRMPRPPRLALLCIDPEMSVTSNGEPSDASQECILKAAHDRSFSELGIRTVRYNPNGPLHPAIDEILEQLCELANRSVRPKISFGYPGGPSL